MQTQSIKTFSSAKYDENGLHKLDEKLTVEEMLHVTINGNPYTITMRTPGYEEAHTRGILLSENVYSRRDKHPIFEITEQDEEGVISKVNVIIPEEDLLAGINEKRNLLSVSSCGMCGKYEMDVSLHGILQANELLNAQLVSKMFEKMSAAQNNFNQSGGCHAAALFTIEGELLDCKEDIGRHNAVDKTIGQLLLNQDLQKAQCLLVSGRISYEIVSKAHKASIPFLCSVSAPSSMAVDYCRESGITLLAFCRGKRFTVYANEQAIVF